MKIIIEGHEIETQNIWNIDFVENTREVKIIIGIKNSQPIIIGRHIPYETYSGQFQQYWAPYKKLYKEIKDKWELNKSDILVFKLDN